MKIGTITFHWATNYGAVLQSYALQKYLLYNNFDTEIINYSPIKNRLRYKLWLIKNMRIKELALHNRKEKKIENFRKKRLKLSKKYSSDIKLLDAAHDYDVYICGSDQIWNESFTLRGELRPTLSYFLKFVPDGKKRISYAASFGTDELSDEVHNLVKPELGKFSHIGVRENSGKKIVEDMGLAAQVVLDPTLLLRINDYEQLLVEEKPDCNSKVFTYVLHENQSLVSKVINYILNEYFDGNVGNKCSCEAIGVEEWLYHIKNSELIVTNSYHGVIFSIIFNKPFLVVPVEGKKMNNRIITLLSAINMESRIVSDFNKGKVDNLFKADIDWDEINRRIEKLRMDSVNFLKSSLKNLSK